MEETDVINTVTHHNESVKTNVYIEARVLVRVKSCRAEYVGVRRAAGHYLYPAHVLTNAATLSAANETTHIDLKTWLNEREKSCSHTNGNVLTKYLGENTLYHYLARSIGEILVNDKRFILEEGALVTGVGRFVSVNSTGVNEAVRGLVCLHIAHAVTRKMRTQAELVVYRTRIVSLKPISIHALTSGVVGGEVQIVKRIIFACDLGTREHLKSH